jgi:hypothetical protein
MLYPAELRGLSRPKLPLRLGIGKSGPCGREGAMELTLPAVARTRERWSESACLPRLYGRLRPVRRRGLGLRQGKAYQMIARALVRRPTFG